MTNKQEKIPLIGDNSSETIKISIITVEEFIKSIKMVPTEPVEVDQEGGESSSDQRSFKDLCYHWEQTCLSFFQAFPLMQQVANYVHMNRAREGIATYIKDSSISVEAVERDQGETENIYMLDNKHRYKIAKSIEELLRFQRAEKSINRAQLLALIAEYEAFIADLLRIIIQSRPEAFFSRESTIPVFEIIKGNDLNDIKRKLIEDRILNLQRDSCVDQIKFIFNRLNIKGPTDFEIREFAEICERRNLLTHANGIVNQSYIDKLEKMGFSKADLNQIGQELEVNNRYMLRSVARVFQMGYFTLHLVWQHLRKEEEEESIKILINCSHEFLLNDLTKMSRRIASFILNSKSPAGERDRAFATVNLALSHFLENETEESDRKKKVAEVLDTRDWSIVNAQFSLALCCLREEYDNLPKLIDAAVHEGVERTSFLTWALFTKVRELPIFKEKMQEHFGVMIESP